MENGFWFAGRNSKDFNIKVEHFPVQSAPKNNRISISVAGRNGDLHYDEGSYQNYQQSYSIGFIDTSRVAATAHEIKNWLFGAGANQRLEDVYDPLHFRLATFSGPIDIENKLNKIGKCTVTFDCSPQCFLKSGEVPVTMKSHGVIENLFFTAFPIIFIYGSGSGSLTVNDITVNINQIESHIVLDCETQQAYQEADGTRINRNSSIYAPEFPTLRHGANPISWSGNIQSVKVIPRWWEL